MYWSANILSIKISKYSNSRSANILSIPCLVLIHCCLYGNCFVSISMKSAKYNRLDPACRVIIYPLCIGLRWQLLYTNGSFEICQERIFVKKKKFHHLLHPRKILEKSLPWKKSFRLPWQRVIASLDPHRNGTTNQVGEVITPPCPWLTPAPLYRGWSQQDLALHIYWGILVTRPNQPRWGLSIRRSGSTFSVLWISQLRTLSQSITQ